MLEINERVIVVKIDGRSAVVLLQIFYVIDDFGDIHRHPFGCKGSIKSRRNAEGATIRAAISAVNGKNSFSGTDLPINRIISNQIVREPEKRHWFEAVKFRIENVPGFSSVCKPGNLCQYLLIGQTACKNSLNKLFNRADTAAGDREVDTV